MNVSLLPLLAASIQALYTNSAHKQFCITLTLRAHYSEFSSIQDLHFLIDAVGEGYIGVWVAHTSPHNEAHHKYMLKDKDWTFCSHHDSCWKKDGFEAIEAEVKRLLEALKVDYPHAPEQHLKDAITIAPSPCFCEKVQFTKVKDRSKYYAFTLENVVFLENV